MAQLEKLGIAGFRSYSAEKIQTIEFNKPLSLIWGENGSGKTTIIEVLKYITTGVLPPGCDKGKLFVTDPRTVGRNEINAQTKLKFRAFNGRPVMATRRSLLSISNKGAKYESLEQILKTKDDNDEPIEINHQCAQIQKQIPMLLGSSKAILQNIVFCHQDESLWPFYDSITLKDIFDELFDTKVCTTTIDLLWEQRKEMQKKINESKKALPYMEKLYEMDKINKIDKLKQMEGLIQKTEEIAVMKREVEKRAKQLKEVNDEELTQKRIQIVKRKQMIESTLAQLNRQSQNLRMRQGVIAGQHSPVKQLHSLSDEQVMKKINLLNQQLEQIKKKKEQAKEQLSLLQNDSLFTQKEVEINYLVSHAKQFIPKSSSLSDNEVCKRLTTKMYELTQKKNHLVECKKQLQRCDNIKMSVEVSLDQKEFKAENEQIKNIGKKLSELKNKIISYYKAMYRPVDEKFIKNASKSSKFEHAEHELGVLQYQLSLKRKQLEQAKKMPFNSNDVKQKIMKLRFAGIDYYQGYLQFCKTKGKCSLCSKPITPEELRSITIKIEKMKSKTEQQIAEIESKCPNLYDPKYQGVNPQVLISNLVQFIKNGEEKQKILIENVKKQKQMVQAKTQLDINNKLEEGLRVVRLDKEHVNNNKEFIDLENPTMQDYTSIIRKYLDMQHDLNRKLDTVRRYQQNFKKNEESKQKNQELHRKRHELTEKLRTLESEVSQYESVRSTVVKLQQLLKERQKNPNRGNTSKSKKTLSELSKQIQEYEQHIKLTTLELQFAQNIRKYHDISKQLSSQTLEVSRLDQELSKLEMLVKERMQKKVDFQKFNSDYMKKQNQMDSLSNFCNQQFFKPVQKQYLLEKMKVTRLERRIKQLDSQCQAIETAVSTIHRDKMDQVNRIIAEVWREIYHEGDIASIEVHTQIETDAKKRRNYKYSILMQKRSINTSKIEMRGRCSMGQKVLASIVIRLALAQVFSSSARILALDEPTTFLDRGHIQLLASQLGKLIEINEGNNSLQLIIISHDLEFVKMLQKYTDHYYEVSRDQDQFSKITRKDIRELFEKKRVF